MNTLSRAVTAQIFPTINEYRALQRHWSALVNSERRHELTAGHHLLYLALLGKDWRRGFTPLTNRRKLDNGAFYAWGLLKALHALHDPGATAELLAPFAGRVTEAMLEQIRGLIPLWRLSRHGPENFAPGAFPFDAYLDPAELLGAVEAKDLIYD